MHINRQLSKTTQHYGIDIVNFEMKSRPTSNIDQGYINILTMLDLSKGFEILIETFFQNMQYLEMYYHGLIPTSTIGNSTSFKMVTTPKLLPVSVGVPQDTVLDRILFLIYTNGFPSVLKMVS